MKFTIGWLKEHLDTKYKDNKIVEKLTDVGLEVESFENVSSELDNFKVAKIINAEQHPNADRLKVCDVDIGEKNTVKVVCGAPNAKPVRHNKVQCPLDCKVVELNRNEFHRIDDGTMTLNRDNDADLSMVRKGTFFVYLFDQ